MRRMRGLRYPWQRIGSDFLDPLRARTREPAAPNSVKSLYAEGSRSTPSISAAAKPYFAMRARWSAEPR